MNVDYAVVGAGVAGASIAYHLKRMDPVKDVLLLDKFSGPCQGNSVRSAAKIRDTVTSSVNRALCKTSIECYKEIQKEGHDLGLSFMGYLWLMDDLQLKENEDAIQEMRQIGIDIEVLGSTQLEDIFSKKLVQKIDSEYCSRFGLNDATFALLGKNCGSIDPKKLVSYYVTQFRNLGGKEKYDSTVKKLIYTHCGDEPISSLCQDRLSGLNVICKYREGENINEEEMKIFADKTIFATGAYSPQILEPNGVRSFVLPRKRQLCEVSIDVFDDINLNGNGMPFTILPSKGIYFWRQTEGRVVLGCADDLGRPFLFEEDPKGEKGYFEKDVMPILAMYFPDFEKADKSSMGVTAGQYNYSIDGMPNIDELVDGLIICNGQSGRGIMEADAIGRIAASLAQDKDSAELFGGEEFDVSWLSVKPGKRNIGEEKFKL